MNLTIPALASVLAIGISVSCRVAPSSTASAQIDKWSTASSGVDHFALSEIQGLGPWSAAYVFNPYTSTTTMNQTLGFEWRGGKRFDLESRDDIHLAVFVSGTNVVHVEEWRRDKFDCSPALTGRALTPSTIIRVDRSRPLPAITIAEPDDGANRG